MTLAVPTQVISPRRRILGISTAGKVVVGEVASGHMYRTRTLPALPGNAMESPRHPMHESLENLVLRTEFATTGLGVLAATGTETLNVANPKKCDPGSHRFREL